MRPVRGGPEWWMVFAAAYVSEFQRARAAPNHLTFDEAATDRAMDAEFAAAVADNAIAGYAEAVKAGCIKPLRKRRT